MEIHVAHGNAPAEWNELVRQDAAATFFHTSHWNGLLERTEVGFRPVWFLLHADGVLAAGLPAAFRERGGFRVLSSMPYGTFGGAVVADGAPEGAGDALVDAFRKAAREPRVAAAHIVDLSGRLAGSFEGFEAVEATAQVLRLDRDFETLWAGFKPSARNKIRKARKAGVIVRRAKTEEDFLAYHQILAECETKWGGRPGFGTAFFRRLSTIEGDLVQMHLAVYEDEVIAGDINFVMHGTVFNWGNVSREEAKRLAPNNILHAVAIEEGLRAGRSLYNLGSSAGIPGVEAFKESFGTVRLAYQEYTTAKPWYRIARTLASGLRGGRS